ncbi:MAG: DUF2157 domain-containing protein, partial [Ilumatobacteraceae bacterium]
MIFGLVLLIGIIAGVAWLVSWLRGHESSSPRSPLEVDLARWVRAGILTDEQAAAILAHEGETRQVAASVAERVLPTETMPHRVPPIAEALGYVGAMLGIVGLVLLVSRFWVDMGTPARLALSGAGAVVLIAAGAMIHAEADPAFVRLRSFVWLAAAAATALCAGVAASDGLGAEGAAIAAACTGAVAVESGILWRWRDGPLPQAAALAAGAGFVGTMTSEVAGPGPAGIAVWVFGGALVFAGLRRLTPSPVLTVAVGAVAAVVGAAVTTIDWQPFGLPFAVGTALALLGVATVPGLARARAEQLAVGIVGALALIESTPGTLGYFARDAGIVTGSIAWSIGAAILFAGSTSVVRVRQVAELLGGAALIGGAALTGSQSVAVATVFGLTTAMMLVALGMIPGQVMLSVLGCLGLLVNVPWAISYYFPGEGRAPLLIMVCGLVILGVAVFLSRVGGRLRRELRPPHHGAPPPAMMGHAR